MVKSNEKKPTVGIALLAYNYGKYINDAISSLKAQTFQDFEVYLMDDGSNDGETPQKLRELEYEKISQKILHKKNMGNAARRRELYGLIQNKYILDMSADDALEPKFLEKSVKFLEEHPEHGAVSVGILEYLDGFQKEPFAEFKYDEEKMKLPQMLAECHMLGSSLMRKSALDETDLGGGLTRYLDWDKWISMLEAGWKLGAIQEPLFKYRVHGDSLSHSSSADTETEVFLQIVKKHSALYEKYYEYVEGELFRSMFAVVRNSDALVWSNEALKKANAVLTTENQELKNELRISQKSLTNRILRKIKKTLGF